MPEYDYDKLLSKVQDQTESVKGKESRFTVPQAKVFYEGRTTVVKNFDKIAGTINRDPDHILKFLLRELGTAGERDGQRVVFQGKIPADKIQNRINDYLATYVLCQECNKPDTHLVKEGRTVILRCDACGAFRPIKSQKKGKTAEETGESVKEGEVYEVTIKDIGKKGDGVAYRGKYIIYVSGAVKGSTVKVKIEKVSGTIAFGRVV